MGRAGGYRTERDTMKDNQAALDAAFLRLKELRELAEHREFMLGASHLRASAPVELQVELDGARDRLEEAARNARRLGMEWGRIGTALNMSEDEARQRYGGLDSPTPEPGRGPVQYKW
jgi:hypothetical protein